MKIELEKGKVLPPIPKRGRYPVYPFRTMEVDESFKVDPTEEKPDPLTRLKGSVSIANKKLAPKHFEIRRDGVSARIFRTA